MTNSVHDLGGMDNMGPVIVEENEPVFHEDWERRVFSLTLATLAAGYFRTDEIRRTIEDMLADEYLSTSYYEHWLAGLTALMLEKDVLTPAELASGKSQRDRGMRLPPLPKEAAQFAMTNPLPANVDADVQARFKVGDRVHARNMHPMHHTRIPRYCRDKEGVIDSVQAVFLLPDTNAYGGPDTPEYVYTVRFSYQELFGPEAPAKDSLFIDMFESYLEPA